MLLDQHVDWGLLALQHYLDQVRVQAVERSLNQAHQIEERSAWDFDRWQILNLNLHLGVETSELPKFNENLLQTMVLFQIVKTPFLVFIRF